MIKQTMIKNIKDMVKFELMELPYAPANMGTGTCFTNEHALDH